MKQLITIEAGIQPHQINTKILSKTVDGELDVHKSNEIGQIETSHVDKKRIVKQNNNMSTNEPIRNANVRRMEHYPNM